MRGLVGYLFAGLFAVNGIPHFVQGICGKEHMTPFARRSRPLINVWWGMANFVVAWLILYALGGGPTTLLEWLAFGVGGAAVATFLSAFWRNPEAKLPWHK